MVPFFFFFNFLWRLNIQPTYKMTTLLLFTLLLLLFCKKKKRYGELGTGDRFLCSTPVRIGVGKQEAAQLKALEHARDLAERRVAVAKEKEAKEAAARKRADKLLASQSSSSSSSLLPPPPSSSSYSRSRRGGVAAAASAASATANNKADNKTSGSSNAGNSSNGSSSSSSLFTTTAGETKKAQLLKNSGPKTKLNGVDLAGGPRPGGEDLGSVFLKLDGGDRHTVALALRGRPNHLSKEKLDQRGKDGGPVGELVYLGMPKVTNL